MRLFKFTADNGPLRDPEVLHVIAPTLEDALPQARMRGAVPITKVEMLADYVIGSEPTSERDIMICPYMISGRAGDPCAKCGDGPCQIVRKLGQK